MVWYSPWADNKADLKAIASCKEYTINSFKIRGLSNKEASNNLLLVVIITS